MSSLEEEYKARLKMAAIAGLPLPTDVAKWFLSALSEFESGACKTLCRALGLRRPGLSSPATRAKMQKRNELIRTIAKQYPGPPAVQARNISDVLQRWPLGAGELKPLYQMLRALDVAIPGREQIENIIKKEN